MGDWKEQVRDEVMQKMALVTDSSKEVQVIVAMNSCKKVGVVITMTDTQILVGAFDEQKGQKAGNAVKASIAFADYLVEVGYLGPASRAGAAVVQRRATLVPTIRGQDALSFCPSAGRRGNHAPLPGPVE